MARGINKVILVGNIGGDPDVRATQSGTSITTINLATSEQWRDKQSGEMREATEWHRVKFFNRLAEIAGEYLRKGQQVYIEGSLRTDKYTDKNGIERYSTVIVANEMQMLGGRAEGGSRGGYGNQGSSRGQGGYEQRGGYSDDHGGGNYGGGNYGGGNQGQYAQNQGARGPARGHASASSPAPAQDFGGGDFNDDDIPF